jgi:hypothetical protein
MNLENIIGTLKYSELVKFGFQITLDIDKNVYLVKDSQNRFLELSFPISKKDYTLYTPISSIAFKELQRLWVDLCYEAIARRLDFKVTPKWREEHYPSFTTQMYGQVNTPAGVIESKFKTLTVKDFFNLEGIDNESIGIEKYLDYLTEYYHQCSEPFFKAIPDIYVLDKMTDGLDFYHLSLYLSINPSLKKVLLTQITNNPNKKTYFEEFRNRVEPHKDLPNVAPVYASLMKIKDYFNNVPR